MTAGAHQTGFYSVKLPHWTFEETQTLALTPHDGFCVRRGYHVMLSRDVPGEPGWHVSFRDYCSDIHRHRPRPRVPRRYWNGDVPALQRVLGVRFEFLRTGQNGTIHHYHERLS